MSTLYPEFPPVSPVGSAEEKCCAGCAGELAAGDAAEEWPGNLNSVCSLAGSAD